LIGASEAIVVSTSRRLVGASKAIVVRRWVGASDAIAVGGSRRWWVCAPDDVVACSRRGRVARSAASTATGALSIGRRRRSEGYGTGTLQPVPTDKEMEPEHFRACGFLNSDQ
jgi:hypothetical protein